MIKGKNIVIGLTGGIACYKTANLISLLKKKGANIDVIMTKNSQNFITPLTLRTLSQSPVVVDMFKETNVYDVKHISLAEKADMIVIIPASANIIGKVAHGIADDMLSTVVMASTCPVVFAPAMNNNMYTNKIVQDNIQKLSSYGYKFISPKVGHLACGTTAIGKLADISDVLKFIEKEFDN